MWAVVIILTVALAVVPNANAQNLEIVDAFPSLEFRVPVGLCNAGDGSNRLFVLERKGLIRYFENSPDASQAEAFLDLEKRVDYSFDEMGLLGLAFHPEFKYNGYFYVYYTVGNPLRSIISRFNVNPERPSVADPGSEVVILSIDQPWKAHKGGQLAFGPDGYLYIALGDGACCNDPWKHAQDRTTLLGSILRIDVNHVSFGRNYSIPEDNPFVGNSEGFREEIYAYGLRNPWRFSFEPGTGRLWAGDVGEALNEEINLIQRGGNYGWPIKEGFICNRAINPDCDSAGLISPVFSYSRDVGGTVIGGYVYQGAARSELHGMYVYGDFLSGKIWGLSYDGTSPPVNVLISESNLMISSFGVDEAGELYVVSYYTGPEYRNGRIHKFAVPLGVKNSDKSSPGSDFMVECRPNPASSRVAVSFHVSDRRFATLTITDVLGRTVRTLTTGTFEPGPHEVITDVDGLPNGVYYCRLLSDDSVAITRLDVMK